jgi:NAD-dependent dihydropyrimidine dehydrogenase PreA subunit
MGATNGLVGEKLTERPVLGRSQSLRPSATLSKKLVEVCPVNIFKQAASGALEIVQENLDECTLCDLCIEAAPAGTVRVIKLYES